MVVTAKGRYEVSGDVVASINANSCKCATPVDAVEPLVLFSSWNQPIGIEAPLIANCFCVDGSLLEERRALGINRDTCVRGTRAHRSGVIARIDAIHPTAVAIEPAITEAR